MKRNVKNYILWILCILNYIALAIIYIKSILPMVLLDFRCYMWAVIYLMCVSPIVTIVGIVLLICRWIKNKRLKINNIIMLILFVLFIPVLVQLGFAIWLASAFGI